MEIICVTGMHRSGTSLVGGVLGLLGVSLGDPDDLLEPAPDNPRGFFESKTVKTINDRVLAALGGTWHEPPPLPSGWERASVLDPIRKDAVREVRERFGDRDLVAWKDPRLSLTMPFWHTIAETPKRIMILRHPDEVAASLAHRNGFAPEKSAELWLRYTVESLAGRSGDVLLVRYDDFFADLPGTVRRIAAHVGRDVEDHQLQRITDFFAEDLRHHAAATLPDGPSLRLARQVFALLSDQPESTIPLLHALRARWAGSAAEQELSERVAEADEQLSALRTRVREQDDRIGLLTHRVTVARAAEERAVAEELRSQEVIHDLRRETADLRDQMAELHHENDRLERERARLASVEDQHDRLKRDHGRVEEELQALRQERQALTAARDAERNRRIEAETSYTRLRTRRGVRLALAVAALCSPMVRLIRRGVRRVRGSAAPSPPPRSAYEEVSPTATSDEVDVAALEEEPSLAYEPDRQADHLAYQASLADAPGVTVVVPIHNAAEEVQRCLEALVRNTTAPAELLLIDDASTDARIGPLLASYGDQPHVRVLRNEENLGFTRTVNRGFQEASGDVVILNSDARVTPRWLENLRFAAYRGPGIGTVTPLSDNAGAFSVPEMGRANPLPPNIAEDDFARLVTRWSERRYPQTPTGNGFCMYVKRALLDAIGPFDAEAFPRGYGEENDFCMRAVSAGWNNVVDDATIVFHTRESSFGSEKRGLVEHGRTQVDARHPDYTRMVREFVSSEDMETVRAAVARIRAYAGSRSEPVPRRVLFVVHQGMGGTPQTNLDLMQALQPGYECFALLSDTKHVKLHRMDGANLEVIDHLALDAPLRFGELTRPEYANFVGEAITRLGIELVHVRHLIKHTFDAPRLAAAFGVPVVLSVHDFYLSCPTVHLLDDKDRFCGGVCTSGPGRCRIPMPWIEETAPPLKHAWVDTWRAEVAEVLGDVTAMVTTSPFARDVYRRSYPQIADLPFPIIEHGRDLVQHRGAGMAPTPGELIRILVPGNLDVHKGADFIAALRDADADGRLEFHFMGKVEAEYEHLGVNHGPYRREDFVTTVESLAPAFIGLFSITAETYNHTLTEAWAAGVPVVVSNLGALEERVTARGGGIVVDISDAPAAVRSILEVADAPDRYKELAASASVEGLPATSDMAAEYAALYERVWAERRVLHEPSADELRPLPVRVGLLAVGEGDRHPGSVHIRTLRRLHHPGLRGVIDTRRYDVERLLAASDWLTPPEVLLIQRTAVPPERVDELIAWTRQQGIPLVVDLDDNLVDVDHLPTGADHDAWHRYAPSVQRLLKASSLATVSTDALRDVVSAYAPVVEVVPNQLDELLWTCAVDELPEDGDEVRFLFMGTKTHGRDLALLKDGFEAARSHLSGRLVLEVIGGEPEAAGQDWYRRIPIPSGTTHYPEFVRWLRTQRRRWHAAVAPLAATPFNRFKSDLKYLEYSALGLAGAYSNWGPYAATVRHGHTGILVEPSSAAWEEALLRLAEHAAAREAMAVAARDEVLRGRLLRHGVGTYGRMLRAQLGRHEPTPGTPAAPAGALSGPSDVDAVPSSG